MIEKSLSLFERLVVGIEKLAESGLPNMVDETVRGPGKTEDEFVDEVGKEKMAPFNKETDSSFSEPKTYEQLLEEHGLPYLKELCEKRGLNFPKLARSNTIIALLKDSDKEAGLLGSCLPETKEAATPGPETSTPADPFAVEAPVVEDPFATTPASETDPLAGSKPESGKEVTEDDVRSRMYELKKVYDNKFEGQGIGMIVAFLEKQTGVRGFNTWADNIPKENRKKEFSAMLRIVNSEISGMSK